MFYFDEDEKNGLVRGDSVSSRSSTISTGSLTSVDTVGALAETPLTLVDGAKTLPTSPLAVSVASAPIPVGGSAGASPKHSPSSFGRSPTSRLARKKNMAASPNAKRTRTRRADTLTKATFEELYDLSASVLGRGAYAQVRTCRNRVTDNEYAVKIIEKSAGHSRSRVIKEIETFDMCKAHPNIVQLVEFFEETDRFYIIFEMMHGGPLLNHIQRRVYFTEQEAAMVTRDIAHALKYLHDRGIAHRDVKPENVLCQSVDFVSPVKLCDLDLASKADTISLAQSINKTPELRSPVGSAEFMAPEVVDTFVGEALRYDKRCDMWSLGVIVYIMLCGYPPFYGECHRTNCGWNEGEHCSDCQELLFRRIQQSEFTFPSEDWERVSEKAKDLIKRLLVKDAKKRLTADEVLEHPWLNTDKTPKTPLQTPDVLLRNDSARDLHQIKENFGAADRLGVFAGGLMGALGPMQEALVARRVKYGARSSRTSISSLSRLALTQAASKSSSTASIKQLAPCNRLNDSFSPGRLSQRPSDEGVAVHS